MEIFKDRDLSLPSVPALKVEIPAITLTIEYDKKISLTTLLFIVLAIARILLKQILKQINKKLVGECCGKRYERGKMQRNGYRRRTIVSLLVEFESRRKYQSDIKAISVESALRMTYRDARDEIRGYSNTKGIDRG